MKWQRLKKSVQKIKIAEFMWSHGDAARLFRGHGQQEVPLVSLTPQPRVRLLRGAADPDAGPTSGSVPAVAPDTAAPHCVVGFPARCAGGSALSVPTAGRAVCSLSPRFKGARGLWKVAIVPLS